MSGSTSSLPAGLSQAPSTEYPARVFLFTKAPEDFIAAGYDRIKITRQKVPPDGDVVELEKNDGIFIPKATPYWFESAGDGPLEIFHVVARDTRVEKNERINYEALKDWQEEIDLGGRDATAAER